MPRRSSVYRLPAPVGEALDRRLVASAFSGYAGHAAWLQDQGHPISESALQRYGRRLQDSMARERARVLEASAEAVARVRAIAEMATAIGDAHGDSPQAVGAAASDMLMARLYDVAMTDRSLDAKALQGIARAMNDSIRTSAALRKEGAEILDRAAAAADKAARQHKALDPAATAALRTLIERGPEAVEKLAADASFQAGT